MKFITSFILLFTSFQFLFSQDKILLDADYIPHTDTTLVFLPSDYDTVKIYPMLFMLHGYSGNYNSWNELVNIQEYADKYQFIIVCPDGFFSSWYIDSPVKPDWQYEKFFRQNLVPHLTKYYSIDWRNIFITGLSMGGHGAIYLLIKDPDFFTAAASTSGILDLTEFPERWSLREVLGSYYFNPQNWYDHSCLYILKNIEWSYKPIYIDCGTEDFAFQGNKKFKDLCLSYGIKVYYNFTEGDHTAEYWKKSIENHFKFFKALSLKN